MKPRKFSRRQFLLATALAAPALVVADGALLEPSWLEVRHVPLPGPKIGCRCVHFTDIHHKGDREYLQNVVTAINAQNPDYVFFTGDLIEDRKYFPETLELLSGVKAPIFGVPGNHDYWSQVPFATIQKSFAANGGAWLVNRRQTIADGKINLIGITFDYPEHLMAPPQTGVKNIVLLHYPAWVKKFKGPKLDLMLAGHSHGGQVRLPFYGPLFVPYLVDEYDMGLFQTPAGPLYVNPGIGYLHGYHFRFNCRPEITVFDI